MHISHIFLKRTLVVVKGTFIVICYLLIKTVVLYSSFVLIYLLSSKLSCDYGKALHGPKCGPCRVNNNIFMSYVDYSQMGQLAGRTMFVHRPIDQLQCLFFFRWALTNRQWRWFAPTDGGNFCWTPLMPL